MHFQVFNAHGIAMGNICDIGVIDFVPVDDDHQSAADRLHAVALQHARIFAKPDADAGRVRCHYLRSLPKRSMFGQNAESKITPSIKLRPVVVFTSLLNGRGWHCLHRS